MTVVALFGATGRTGGRVLTRALGAGSFRVRWVGVNASTQISRNDLADFVLTQVTDRTYVHSLPFVSA
jgi:hypothetical protein